MTSNSPLAGAHPKSSILKTQTSQTRHDFIENGWVLIDLNGPDFDIQAREIIAGVAPRYNGTKRVIDAWKWCAAVKRLAENARVLETLHTLYKNEPRPFQTLNFPVGTNQPAHSDCIHFSADPPEQMAGVWVALEDTDRENGALYVCPGSHKLPVYHMQDFGLRPQYEDYPLYEKAIERIIKERGLAKQPLYLRKGQAVIWSANLLHGGSQILDGGRTRHSQATHYFFKGSKTFYRPLLSDLKNGRIFDHPSPGFSWLDRLYAPASKLKRVVKHLMRGKAAFSDLETNPLLSR